MLLAHSWRGDVLHTGETRALRSGNLDWLLVPLDICCSVNGSVTLQHISPLSHLWVTVMIIGEKHSILISISSLLPLNSLTSIFKISTSSRRTIWELGQWSGEEEADRAVRVWGWYTGPIYPIFQLYQQSWTHGILALRCCGFLHWISSCSCGVFTSPNAPLPITFKDSKSSNPSLVLFKRRNSVSFRAWADRLSRF